jgi:hypothetical protein
MRNVCVFHKDSGISGSAKVAESSGIHFVGILLVVELCRPIIYSDVLKVKLCSICPTQLFQIDLLDCPHWPKRRKHMSLLDCDRFTIARYWIYAVKFVSFIHLSIEQVITATISKRRFSQVAE